MAAVAAELFAWATRQPPPVRAEAGRLALELQRDVPRCGVIAARVEVLAALVGRK